MQGLGIGLLGVGTVGGGVARLLTEASIRLARRAGRPLELRWGVVRDLNRARNVPRPTRGFVSQIGPVLEDPSVGVVVETLGGLEPARSWVLAALAAGKDVVTANKALLAEHGPEIFEQARRNGRAVAFEASVGGGIPILQALQVGLAANQIRSVSAILNGTCNFILTAMSRQGMSYESALAQAQALGYAEPDPRLDVDGTDTAHKLAVLAQVSFGAAVSLAQIPRQGIDHLNVDDIRYADELGYAVKLLAQARHADSGLELRVAPRLVAKGTPLAEVRGPYNAIRVVGDAVGDTLFHGRGAGAMPTASAVVADIIDVALGRAAITSRELARCLDAREPVRLAGPDDARSRAYLHFEIADRPGVLGTIARILGEHEISIASVIQHDSGAQAQKNGFVPLVIMTHLATDSALRRAVAEIDALDVVAPPSVWLGVEELAEAGG